MIIDTPEKFEHLKYGEYSEFTQVVITSTANRNVLLQPRRFFAHQFLRMTFNQGDNKITIYPQSAQADIHYTNGENPLTGVSKLFFEYNVVYTDTATVTDENIDAILQWQWAKTLRIYDNGAVAGKLMKRIDEIGKLIDLSNLHLSVNAQSVIDVAAFIEKLPSLKEIVLFGRDMSDEEIKQFEADQKIPSNWSSRNNGQSIHYVKK